MLIFTDAFRKVLGSASTLALRIKIHKNINITAFIYAEKRIQFKIIS